MKRNGKVFKKTLGIVLSAAMLVSGMTFMPGSAVEVQAAATTKDVNLGFGGISDPTSTGSSATAWTGSKVYYGDKLWRVLDDSGFLFSEDLLETKAYHDTFSGITWENCTLRSYLNGQTFLKSNFTGTEQDAIKDTSVTNDSNPDYTTAGGNNTTDKLFLLSLAEVRNTNYGFGSDATRAASSWWWLRSPGINAYTAASVNDDGSVRSNGGSVSIVIGSVRPALNLNLSSVLFSSASGTSKSAFGLVGSNHVGNTWKLTLKDGDTSFAATLPTTGTAGQDITVNTTTAGTGTYSQTSAILEDSNGTVVAYGKIGDAGKGNKTFALPTTLSAGNYTLHVFEEQVNTGNSTDYASQEVAEAIAISAAPTTYDVTITPGSNMTKTSDSGAATQTGLTGAMATVVYTADSFYYFPENYVSTVAGLTNDAVNGVSVTRNSYTQITVSGTPSATTAITLPAATAKTIEDRPDISIDYTNETLTGFVAGASYTINGSAASPSSGTLPADTYMGTIISVVRKTVNVDTGIDSSAEPLDVQARPAAPSPIGVNETIAGLGDGKITGVSTAMEYKLANAQSWADCPGTEINGLAVGNYQVRSKATGSAFASTAANVTIASGAAVTKVLNITAPTFAAITEGDAQPSAQNITIANSGNTAATISDISLTEGDTTAFVLSGSGTDVAAGGSISTRQIQPAAGLTSNHTNGTAKTYTATITVTYDGGASKTVIYLL